MAGVIALVGSMDRREWRRSVTPTSALFNHSQVAVSVIGAGLVFRWAGGADAGWPSLVLPGLLGLVTDIFLNTTLIVVGTAMKQRTSRANVLRSMQFGSRAQVVITYAAYGSLAVVLTAAYRDAGGWALAELAVPLLLARQTILQTTELQRKERVLDDVTTQILIERQDERSRIASALHDEVQQGLYHVTLQAEVIREELRSGRLLALEDDIPTLLHATQRTRSLLREVIRDLRRSDLGVGGLEPTLRSLLADLSGTWTGRIEGQIQDVDADPRIQLLVYQIAREAIQNAVKHSGASALEVSLYRDSDGIGLVVSDDGCGFVTEMVDTTRHFGLEIMRERARLAKGWIEASSRLGAGTRIAGFFPSPTQ